MNKEKISEIINNIDDGFVAEAASYNAEKKDNGKNTVISIQEDRKMNRGFKHGVGFVAMIAACIILLGGVTAYAFNYEAINKFLFGKTDETIFNEVYTSLEKEYVIGNHKLVLNGTIYDDATDVAYISFNVLDNEGKSVSIDNMKCQEFLGGSEKLGYETMTQCFKAGDDKLYFLLTYTDMMYVSPVGENNTYVICANKTDEGEDVENKQIQYAIMDEEAWLKANEEVNKLDFSYMSVTDSDYMPPVLDILDNYGLTSIESKNLTGTRIAADKCEVVVGRTNIMVSYNENNGQDIILMMEDGTKYELVKDGKIDLTLGDYFGKISGNGNGEMTAILGFGGITKENEDLTLIVDGVEYK